MSIPRVRRRHKNREDPRSPNPLPTVSPSYDNSDDEEEDDEDEEYCPPILKRLAWSVFVTCRRIVCSRACWGGVASSLFVSAMAALYIRSQRPDPRLRLLFGNRTAVQLHYRNVYNHTFDKVPSPPVIFYNVYIPDDGVQKQHGLSIVKEQFSQMARAGPDLRIHIHTIGADVREYLQPLCREHQCEIQHAETGDEVNTLQHLYEYCLQHAEDRVVYLHSKGSFHNNRVNDAWRIALTAAALHPDCGRCLLCGLQFFTQFTLFFPGNMWSAQCHYVQRLQPPNEFGRLRETVVERFLLMRLQNQLQSRLLRDRRDYFGLDRYSTEHWIASHPDVQVCDMEPLDTLTKVFRRNSNMDSISSELSWSPAPRHVGFAVGNNWDAHKKLNDSRVDRLREYFLLPGLLLGWDIVYGKTPSVDSWVWKWFPDGDFWKNQTQKYSNRVVDYTARSLPAKQSVSRSYFQHSLVGSETLNSSNNVVFYHVSNATDTTRIQEQLKIVSQQLPLSTVVMNIYGKYADQSRDTIISFCSNRIDCRIRNVNAIEHKGETLQHLYDYCVRNPSSRVSYINTGASLMADHPSLIPYLTRAAVSRLCLEPRDTACNVCGLSFYTMWTLFFPGNMFAASCDYVGNLLRPSQFQSTTETAVKRLLLAELRKQVQFGLFSFSQNRSGLYDFDHWIGSHPELRPCDLVSKPLSDDFKVASFDWGIAPRHHNAPFMEVSENRIRAEESSRMREHQYLAGQLIRWNAYYGAAPRDDSWVWTWFPDGRRWRDDIATYGLDNVVKELTKGFAVDGM